MCRCLLNQADASGAKIRHDVGGESVKTICLPHNGNRSFNTVTHVVSLFNGGKYTTERKLYHQYCPWCGVAYDDDKVEG